MIPGDVIVTGDYRPGMFVQRRGSDLVASDRSRRDSEERREGHPPLRGLYPGTEDMVVGKIVSVTGYGWEADINSCFVGYLPGSSSSGGTSPRDAQPDHQVQGGDLLLAKIEHATARGTRSSR